MKYKNTGVPYEKSFAYHIEQELGLDINDIWDFEKNTVNPYHIPKNRKGFLANGEDQRVWVKCQEKDYHGSYLVVCNNFTKGQRCPYCSSKRVHPLDSFAQYHIENTDTNFLDKYWDWGKNNELGINPWEIAPKGKIKVWIKCNEKGYHKSNFIRTLNYSNRKGICNQCNPRKEGDVHLYDSFGYNNIDKVMSWSDKNTKNPFKISKSSRYLANFICPICNKAFNRRIDHINEGRWCSNCKASKGELRIENWLVANNINFVYDAPYFKDLKGVGGGILRPDFILPDHKIWIEYDGEFHYKNIANQLERQQHNDKLKDEYAKKNDWKMIRIPYWDFDKIEEILGGSYERYKIQEVGIYNNKINR